MLQSAIQKYKKSVICHSDITTFIRDLQLNTTISFLCRYAQRFHKLVFLSSEPAKVWNTVYVEFEFTFRLREQTAPSALKCWLTQLQRPKLFSLKFRPHFRPSSLQHFDIQTLPHTNLQSTTPNKFVVPTPQFSKHNFLMSKTVSAEGCWSWVSH